ncbi:MAG: hypothetical protein NXI04_13255 [Planctomycetaceae bacterium]|nr:hypothetical protein [Planctomycetaceae bacterium]
MKDLFWPAMRLVLRVSLLMTIILVIITRMYTLEVYTSIISVKAHAVGSTAYISTPRFSTRTVVRTQERSAHNDEELARFFRPSCVLNGPGQVGVPFVAGYVVVRTNPGVFLQAGLRHSFVIVLLVVGNVLVARRDARQKKREAAAPKACNESEPKSNRARQSSVAGVGGDASSAELSLCEPDEPARGRSGNLPSSER